MDANELARLLAAGNYYGLVVRAARLLLAKEHPDAQYAVLAVHLRDGVPDLMIPVIPPASSSPSQPPAAPRP
jgi:hypothetical protein